MGGRRSRSETQRVPGTVAIGNWAPIRKAVAVLVSCCAIMQLQGGLPGGQLLKRGSPKDFFQTVLRLFEQRTESTIVALLTVGDLAEATLQRDFAINGLDDLEYRDPFGGAGQSETTARTALGTEDSCLRQILEDLGQEAFGNVFIATDGVDHHRQAGRLPHQVQQPEDPVFASSRDMHDVNQTKSVRMLLLLARVALMSTRALMRGA